MSSKNDESIPFPQLKSFRHKRTVILKKKWKDILKRHYSENHLEQIIMSSLTRFLKTSHLLSIKIRFHLYRLVIKEISLFYKMFYRMEVYGKKNIPKNGAIFYINHPNRVDVVMSFLGALNKPVGVFSDIGAGIHSDILELFGFIPRLGKSSIMIEKMIRYLVNQNKYLAIWPEGTPDKGRGIMQGFSGIIKVYATINSQKNIIPFCPVTMQVSFNPKRNKYVKYIIPKIIFKFHKPFFIDRNWLRHPDKEGKTNREIVDYIMLKIAKKFSQKELSLNPVLERRRKNYLKPWH